MGRLPPPSKFAAAIDLALIVALVSQPSNCACEQSSIRPLPINFPTPEERTEITQVALQEVSSAVSGGSGEGGGTAMPGTGQAIWEGFAPTVIVTG